MNEKEKILMKTKEKTAEIIETIEEIETQIWIIAEINIGMSKMTERRELKRLYKMS